MTQQYAWTMPVAMEACVALFALLMARDSTPASQILQFTNRKQVDPELCVTTLTEAARMQMQVLNCEQMNGWARIA